MELQELLSSLNSGLIIGKDQAVIDKMRFYSRQAQKITMQINNSFHEPEELRNLFSELIGQEIDEGFGLFPPFHTDFGKNIHLGKNVFINSDCKFQDQGGITIGDNALIGHGVVLATLNHVEQPSNRRALVPAPINIGKGVWIGANATITPGVTIGDDAIIGAGSVVTKDIPPKSVAVGVPAKVIRNIKE